MLATMNSTNKKYNLVFSEDIFKSDTIEKAFQLNINKEITITISQNGQVKCYKINRNKKWTEGTVDKLHGFIKKENINSDVLYLVDLFQDGRDILIHNTFKGFNFYEFDRECNMRIILSTHDMDENPFSNWNYKDKLINFGRFYSDSSKTGLLTLEGNNDITFYVVDKNKFQDYEYPFLQLTVEETNLDIEKMLHRLSLSFGNVFVNDVNSNGIDDIVVRTNLGTDVFELDSNNIPKCILSTTEFKIEKNSRNQDSLYFVNFTGRNTFKDAALRNNTGLFVYKYEGGDYKFLSHNFIFSKLKGWKSETYNSDVIFNDFNNDSSEDILFTGPQGIQMLTFNTTINKWYNIFNNDDLKITEKYSQVLLTPNYNNSTFVLTQNNDEIKIGTMKEFFIDTQINVKTNLTRTSKSESGEQIIETVYPEEKFMYVRKQIVYLRDSIDIENIVRNCIDIRTGKPKLVIPIVEQISTLLGYFKLSYDFNTGNSILGNGWSMPNTYIILNDCGSIFIEDHAYFLINQNEPYQMIYNSKKSSPDVLVFKIESDIGYEIKYFKKSERWEIKYAKFTQIFGKIETNNDSVGYDISWKSWRGPGYSKEDMEVIPKSWYLKEVRDVDNHIVLDFSYLTINVPIGDGKIYTREVHIQEIKDCYLNFIKFEYGDKMSSELIPFFESKSKYLTTRKYETKYLKEYTLNTQKFIQKVQFDYKIDGSNRFLEKIRQLGDLTNPVFEFQYFVSKSGISILKNIKFDSEMEIDFDIIEKTDEIKSVAKKIGNRYDFDGNVQIFQIINYVIVTILSADSTILYVRLFTKDMSKEILCKKKNIYAVLEKNNQITFYNIYSNIDEFYIHLKYKNKQEIIMFKLINPCENVIRSYEIAENSNVKIGTDFVVIVSDTLNIIEWDSTEKIWKNEVPKEWEKISFMDGSDFIVEVNGALIAIYYEPRLYVLWKKDNIWELNYIKIIPNFYKNTIRALNNFEINYGNIIEKHFKERALQIHKNVIYLNSIRLNNSVLTKHINIILLKDDLIIEKDKSIIIDSIDVLKLRKTITLSEEETWITGYEYGENKKFKQKVIDFEGTFKTFLKKKTAEEEFREEVIKVENEYKKNATEALIKGEYHLFDIVTFFTMILYDNDLVYNETKIKFTGSDWIKEQIIQEKNETILYNIGGNFVVERLYNDTSNIEIKRREENGEKTVVSILDTNDLNSIVNGFPNYYAYRSNKGANKLIELYEDGNNIKRKYDIPDDEVFNIQCSNSEVLFTELKSVNKTVIIARPMMSTEILVIDKNSFISNRSSKITAYDYDMKSLKDSSYFNRVYIYHGNNKTEFGYIENYMNITTQNVTSVLKYYDSKDVLVKVETEPLFKEEKEEIKSKENVYRNTTLFDKNNQLFIATFFPDQVIKDEGSFLGFEDYEVTKKPNKWNYNLENIVKNSYAFTGKNYLKLEVNEKLTAMLKPENQNLPYKILTWIHPNGFLVVGSKTSILKVNIYNNIHRLIETVLGNVKLMSRGWFLLEGIINLPQIRILQNNTEDIVDKSLNIEIIVNSLNNTVLIDHVFFTTQFSNVQIKVYDYQKAIVTDKIQSNGLITRTIYNNENKKVIHINENNLVKIFKSFSTLSSLLWYNRKLKIDQILSEVIIKSNNGFYSNFERFSFNSHWLIERAEFWKTSDNCIMHLGLSQDKIKLKRRTFSTDSIAIRFIYVLHSEPVLLQFDDRFKIYKNKNDITYMRFYSKIIPLKDRGEVLFVKENTRGFLWIDGVLLIDSEIIPEINLKDFAIELRGKISFCELIVMHKPSLQVKYKDFLGNDLQSVLLENENSAIVTNFEYDGIGRLVKETIPRRIERFNNNITLLTYNEGTYKFKNYIYERTSLLNDLKVMEIPESEFSLKTGNVKVFSRNCLDTFLNTAFNVNEGFSCKTEVKSKKYFDMKVFDMNDNKVANYIYTEGNIGLLSTYEYDENNRLIKILSPLYHKTAKTFLKLGKNVTNEEKEIQKKLGVFYTYNSRGDNIVSVTPDEGKIEKIYNSIGQLKFIINYDYENEHLIDAVVYFNYDHISRLISSGTIEKKEKLILKENLLQLKDIEISAKNTTLVEIFDNIKEYQQFYYKDNEVIHGKRRIIVTLNEDIGPFIEENTLNLDGEIFNKKIHYFPISTENSLKLQIKKTFDENYNSVIEYPFEFNSNDLKLIYKYNKMGQIENIKIGENFIAKVSYDASGSVIEEKYFALKKNGEFNRIYKYNELNNVEIISDKFLKESIYYTENGYGKQGYSDKSVTQTKFEAFWHDSANIKTSLIDEDNIEENFINKNDLNICLDYLLKYGYINKNNEQEKIFYFDSEYQFPVQCVQGSMAKYLTQLIGQKGFPRIFGHSYEYGIFMELTKAKYFINENNPMEPLLPHTFSKEIPDLDNKESEDVWEILKTGGYIIEDNTRDFYSSHGKKGIKDFTRKKDLQEDLKNIDSYFTNFIIPIHTLLMHLKGTITKSKFLEYFFKWDTSNNLIEKREEIWNMLNKKKYLNNYFNVDFSNSLHKYSTNLPDIAKILIKHFEKELGTAEFDVESYGIDANGNHQKFYTGFDRYELKYVKNTNRIEYVIRNSNSKTKPSGKYKIKYNNYGNKVEALYKNIKRIEYYYATSRPKEIIMLNEKRITYSYDANGNRIFKRIRDKNGRVEQEFLYIRDEKQRLLVERQITYFEGNVSPDVLKTAYVYGPRGLIGFFRHDQYYNVLTDHEGSVRLVIKNGEVVAAYDYLPYGGLMRVFGNDPEAHISIRYTGHEWDEEIGLYYMLARFYDPEIGRFLQIDPLHQYFSPYKYAGNSPISLTDPTGEFAFAIFFGLVGAYLGGAAANKSYNPFKWNWKNPKTYVGIGTGFATGFFLPAGFGNAAAALTKFGLGTALAKTAVFGGGLISSYTSVSLSEKSFNPTKWNWSDPKLLFHAFKGFKSGLGIVENSAKNIAKIITLGKTLLSQENFLPIARQVLLGTKNTKWDLSSLASISLIFGKTSSDSELPINLLGFKDAILKQYETIKENSEIADNALKEFRIDKNDMDSKEAYMEYSSKVWKDATQWFLGVGLNKLVEKLNSFDENTDFTSSGTYLNIIKELANGGENVYTVKDIDNYEKTRDNRLNSNTIERNLTCIEFEVTNCNSLSVMDENPLRNKRDVKHKRKRRMVKDNNTTYKESNSYWITSKIKNYYHQITSSIKNITTYNSSSFVPLEFLENSTKTSDSAPFTPDYSVADLNGSIWLIDFCIRKITGEKYKDYSEKNPNETFLFHQGKAIKIIQYFEEYINDNFNIKLDEMIDIPNLQCKVLNVLIQGVTSNLAEILRSVLNDAIMIKSDFLIDYDVNEVIDDFIANYNIK